MLLRKLGLKFLSKSRKSDLTKEEILETFKSLEERIEFAKKVHKSSETHFIVFEGANKYYEVFNEVIMDDGCFVEFCEIKNSDCIKDLMVMASAANALSIKDFYNAISLFKRAGSESDYFNLDACDLISYCNNEHTFRAILSEDNYKHLKSAPWVAIVPRIEDSSNRSVRLFLKHWVSLVRVEIQEKIEVFIIKNDATITVDTLWFLTREFEKIELENNYETLIFDTPVQWLSALSD